MTHCHCEERSDAAISVECGMRTPVRHLPRSLRALLAQRQAARHDAQRALDSDLHHLRHGLHGAVRPAARALLADRSGPARQADPAVLARRRQHEPRPRHRRVRARCAQPPDLWRARQPAGGAAGAHRRRRRRPRDRHPRRLYRRHAGQPADASGGCGVHLPRHPVRAAARGDDGPGPGHAGDRHQPAALGQLRARDPRRGADRCASAISSRSPRCAAVRRCASC